VGVDRATVAAAARVVWRALRRTVAVVRRSDLALTFCGIVTALTITLALSPASLTASVVGRTSTNLANLRTHPIEALTTSVFVVPDLDGLWLVLAMLVALAYGQAWVGRFATIVVLVIGHVGATLFVAILLITGLGAHLVPSSVIFADDVGVSYALVAILGWLTARVARRYRPWYVLALAVYFVAPGLDDFTFNDAGHATALVLGLSLAVLSGRSGATSSDRAVTSS
jgi:hypothetical protein